MLAAHAGLEHVVAALHAHQAGLDSRNRLGMTALMLAAMKGSDAVVQQLLLAGADRSLRNARREQAADLARSNGHVAVAARLDGVAPK
jgi:ankyrin repeat protein